MHCFLLNFQPNGTPFTLDYFQLTELMNSLNNCWIETRNISCQGLGTLSWGQAKYLVLTVQVCPTLETWAAPLAGCSLHLDLGPPWT